MRFRDTTTGREVTVAPETKAFDIYDSSPRWHPLDAHGAEVESPLELLTVNELKSLAADNGIEVPADIRKARLVEIARDAGLQPPAEEAEA